MNKFIAIGNLTRDPETKVTQTGKRITRFTVALNRPYKSQNGDREADFIQFTAYDKTAELAEKYLSKGRKVGIEARVRTGKYEVNGETRWTTEFTVEHLEFLSSAQQDSVQQAAVSTAPATATAAAQEFVPVTVEDDELPF